MKKLLLFAVLSLSMNSFAQFAIVKADGTKINASWVEFDHEREKLAYTAPGVGKDKIKYKELASVTASDYRFKIFKGAEFKGYFIKAETATATLGVLEYTLTAGPQGGFQSSFTHVAVAAFDSSGNLIEEIDMREGKSNKNDKVRGSVIPMVKKHFKDCPALLVQLTPLENKDENNMSIFRYFGGKPDYISCN